MRRQTLLIHHHAHHGRASSWLAMLLSRRDTKSTTSTTVFNKPSSSLPYKKSDIPKQPDRRGDWRCLSCHLMNFSHRNRCVGCKALVATTGGDVGTINNCTTTTNTAAINLVTPAALTSTADKKAWIGDWFCAKCRARNFSRKTVCFECQAPRPPSSTGTGGAERSGDHRLIIAQRVREGDWICGMCRAHNFAKNTVCVGCEQTRIKTTSPTGGEEKRRETISAAHSSVGSTSSSSVSALPLRGPNGSPIELIDGNQVTFQWICTTCSIRNDRDLKVCRRCHVPRNV